MDDASQGMHPDDLDDVESWRTRGPVAEPWSAIASVLAITSCLLFLAAIVGAFSFYGSSMRDRILYVSLDNGQALTAGLALASIGIELAVVEPWSRRRDRLTVACASVVSVAMLVSALYGIAYLGLAHPHVNADVSTTAIRILATAWPVRLKGMLQSGASGVLAGVALYVAGRAAVASTRTSTPTAPTAP